MASSQPLEPLECPEPSQRSVHASAAAAASPWLAGEAWLHAPVPLLLVDAAWQVVAANALAWGGAADAPGRGGVAAIGLGAVGGHWPADDPAGQVLAGLLSLPGSEARLVGLSCGALFDRGGQPHRLLALAAAVSERELLHDRILDNLHDGVLLYDERLAFLGANRSARTILGLHSVDLVGRTADTLGWRQLREDGSPMPLTERPVWRVGHGQPSVEAVTLGVDTGDGQLRWLLINAVRTAPLVAGQQHGVVASFADITRQVQTLRALRESEQRFRLFAEHSHDVIWISDPQARQVLYISPAYERLWGRPIDDLLADHGEWMQAVHPDDRQAVADAYFNALERGQYAAEYRIIRPDGSTLWIRDRGFPIRDADGALLHLAGIAEDITAAHEAAWQTRQRLDTEQQLSRVVATAPGALFTYRRQADGQVSVHLANTRVLAAYGLQGAGPAGAGTPMHDIRDVVLPEDRLKLKQALEVSARSMKAWREEFRARHPRRGEVWVELHAMPVREPDGAVAWHGFLHEITARKQVEEEIRRVNAELEARVAERTEELQARHREMEAFTYSVSHDLKAPLRGIDGYSRLLLTDHADRLDDEGRLFVETIRRATVHMGRLIDDLLTYSRVERSRPTLGPIDPSGVIRQLVSERQRELSEGGVQLDLQLDCQAATGEREGLAMVVRNLLDNAIKFTVGREPRRIRIECLAEGGHCRICVADNGPGFDMRYHDRIFEIFQRLHRAEDYPGTGVGLAIVRKAVERMRGRAWAESAPEQGARFFVELPL